MNFEDSIENTSKVGGNIKSQLHTIFQEPQWLLKDCPSAEWKRYKFC